ncbi:hypothetical protein [Streptomyces sp. G45]|uniref:hypothetical protein n=1 Tax=Streptomyces sp. G45 TaxID=3406627 RepID=UPI003C1F68E9
MTEQKLTQDQKPAKKAPKDYGPIQFPDRIGFALWRFERALKKGLIPPADVGGCRWSAAVVDEVAARAEEIRAATGTLPDMGAGRAADVLSERFGIEVHSEVLIELDRVGLIESVGEYKGYDLYDGQALEHFNDRAALERAQRDGKLLTRTDAAAHLGIRASDIEHLINAKWLEPTIWVRNSRHPRRAAPTVPLFRVGDLDLLAVHPAIDWDEVKATPKGRPSPLAKLTPRAPVDADAVAR